MQVVESILFEPVGCLAEFRAGEFNEIAFQLFKIEETRNRSGSEVYWDCLNRMQKMDRKLSPADREVVEGLELKAVEGVDLYEDVVSAFSELKKLDVGILIASSLSDRAVTRFLEKFSLADFVSAVWTRDNAGGVGEAPIASAIEGASLNPEKAMYLADTEEGLNAATRVGVNSILMINDYDEGRRLAITQDPVGGIVSLHELPDFIRLLLENQNLPVQP